jgi:hypothetical protein
MRYFLCINKNSYENKMYQEIMFPFRTYSKKFLQYSCKLSFMNYESTRTISTEDYIKGTNIKYKVIPLGSSIAITLNDRQKIAVEEIIMDLIEKKKDISIGYSDIEIVKGILKPVYKNKCFFVAIECANCFPKGKEYMAIDLLKKAIGEQDHTIYTNDNELPSHFKNFKLGIQKSFQFSKMFKIGRCMKAIVEIYNQQLEDVYTIVHPERPEIFIESPFYNKIITKTDTEKLLNAIVINTEKPQYIFVNGISTIKGHPVYSDIKDPKYQKGLII